MFRLKSVTSAPGVGLPYLSLLEDPLIPLPVLRAAGVGVFGSSERHSHSAGGFHESGDEERISLGFGGARPVGLLILDFLGILGKL